jgi:cytochrome c oxidase cbb3-type subunit I
MTVESPTPAATCPARPLTAEIDASTRWPILLLSGGAVKWLIISAFAGMLAYPKIHAPGMMSGIPALTYGRLIALQDATFIYGFASQAAMAIALWLICRLGGTRLIGRGAAVVAGYIWNFGVVVGSIGILSGNVSPFEHFQFPQYAMAVLLLGYLVYGVSAILTFSNRSVCTMYPSLWFVLAGLVFFPWVYASAMMTLWSPLVRNMVAPITAGWAANNIVTLWLGSIALASLYYFLPKLSGRDLASRPLAVFAFWLFVLFGQATGMHFTAAAPAWVQGMSEICSLLILVPVAASAVNWFQTIGGKGKKPEAGVAYRFAWWGAALFVISSVLAAITALSPIREVVQFTIFQTGLSQLTLLGFITMSLFAGLSYILPRVFELEWPRPTNLHFTLTLVGALLVAVPLLLGGFIQGSKAANASLKYEEVARSVFPFVGIAILGFASIIAGQFLFLRNIGSLFCRACCPSSKNGGRP